MSKSTQPLSFELSAHEIDYILSTKAIRAQAKAVYDLCLAGNSYFEFHEEKIQPAVEYVLNVIQNKYPDLNIPFHSRWGHFRAAGIDRTRFLNAKITKLDSLEQARIKLDLVITSVLLDAGAGAEWKFVENNIPITRSEGLGVASFHMFLSGIMSHDKKSLRADASGLQALTAKDLEVYFQVTAENPLVGVNGRLQLLNNLATALQNKFIFKDARPGNILDYLQAKFGRTIPATGILRAVLDGLGPIWPGRIVSRGINLGDVWQHSKLGAPGELKSLVPIHKLSQWLTYSLIEPIIEAGFTVTGVEELTGLAEYRNGGLMLDAGILTFKNPGDATKSWTPDSELIIEWRALTVFLLDIFGIAVQKALSKSPSEFPLAKVLEGGTWWAGRFMAQEKRSGGAPPLNIQSDGTVF